VCAVVVGILPFVLLEVSLRGLDIGNPAGDTDPLSGFNSNQKVFELDESAGLYERVRTLGEFFGPQEFSAEKPANEFRVFCLGGSTVRGRPYQTETAFPHWIQIELAARDSTRTYEIINCGGVSYASYRLVPVLREVLQYKPDMIVLATGHNEFLEDRTYQSLKSRSAFRFWIEDRFNSLHTVKFAKDLIASNSSPSGKKTNYRENTELSEKVVPRLDSESGYASYHRDDPWQQQVLEQYDDSLRTMVDLCGAADVPFILVNLGSNLRDCPPFKSEHKPDLSPEAESEWQTWFDRASITEVNDLHQALQQYQQAESIDSEFALLSYRIARCLDRLDRQDEAKEYFVRAKDLDICPLRMLEKSHTVLKSVAEETSTPLVDVRSLLEALSSHGIPGYQWYLDHLHPTIGGHQQIASAIIQQMQQSGLVSLQHGWPAQQRRASYRLHLDRLGPRYLADGRRRIAWLENWARRHRLYDETLPNNANGYLRAGFRRLDFGNERGAGAAFELGIEEDPSVSQQLLDHAALLVQQGRPQTVQRLLEWLMPLTGDSQLQTEIHLALLILAIETEQPVKAAEIYRKHKTEFENAVFSESKWLSLMPDVLSRAEKLGE
jgi:tetratricopeptide (TPR) repeat protein